jgi:Ca-activated chloride channel family protein
VTVVAPWFLALIALIPLGLIARAWWRGRRGRAGVPHPDVDVLVAAAPRLRLRRHLPLALAVLAFAGMAVALARPEVERDQPREQATIMLVMDVSGSMAAEDVEPYRLRAAQDAALRFADEAPRNYQIGLVSFSGAASLLLPPTTDRAAFERAIESLVPDGATAVGDAVSTALDAIRDSDAPSNEGKFESARILLLSDGSSTTGIPVSSAIDQANEMGVPVFTVALGTEEGVLDNGQRVPPDAPALSGLAEATGGESYETRDAESLSAVYERLGSFIGTERVPTEVTGWPAGVAAVLLVMAGVAAWRLSPRLP